MILLFAGVVAGALYNQGRERRRAKSCSTSSPAATTCSRSKSFETTMSDMADSASSAVDEAAETAEDAAGDVKAKVLKATS